MVKSRKLAFLVCFRHSAGNGPGCRLGPPESVEKPEKARKHGKQRKTRFLRVTRASGQGYQRCHSRGNRHVSVSPPASWRRPSTLLRRSAPADLLQSFGPEGPLSTGGGLASPRPPPNRSAAEAASLHCWFSVPGALLHSSCCGSPDSPRKRGGRESLAFPRLQSWVPLVGRAASGPILVRHRRFSRLAPRGGRESFLFLSLTGRGFSPPRPTLNRRRKLLLHYL